MKRVIVLGGRGWFGRAIVELLSNRGARPLVASRRVGVDLRIDANDRASIDAVLRTGDIIVDAGGPFQLRTTALIDAAIEIGFDIIDLNECLPYAEKILAAADRIRATNIRVLSSASTASAVSAAVVQTAGLAKPVRVRSLLAPASRYTANVGTTLSLLSNVGQPIQIYRDGQFVSATGWTDPTLFDWPVLPRVYLGRLLETADAAYLPQIWPSLREVTMHVDANTRGANWLLDWAAGNEWLRRLAQRLASYGAATARRLGSTIGCIGYEIEDSSGSTARCALTSQNNSYLAAVMPALLAVEDVVAGRFKSVGLVLPHQHVEPQRLFWELEKLGIFLRWESPPVTR